MAQYIENNPHAAAQLKSDDVESWLRLHLGGYDNNATDDTNNHPPQSDANKQQQNKQKQALDMRHYHHVHAENRTHSVTTVETNAEHDPSNTPRFQLDKMRTLSMIGWSIGIHTPIYMRLYQFYDRAFPKTTPMSVFLRVAISCAMTAPTNALFFTYGTCSHHLLEEVDMRCNSNSTSYDDEYQYQPQDLQCMARMMAQETQLKLQREYWDTLIRTYQVWTPINVVNFALVPAHLRTLMMCTCTMFWNCYLSLAQHRDIVLPDDHHCNGYIIHASADDDYVSSAATAAVSAGSAAVPVRY
eukprot:CAMPEP_0116014576 /NCGR_PEP_ID=MMETSP0321-20121206/6346_1 /TAXON_ID=163516 /ORGANISM="Leptocylindrus danicus var. danicus, Strain B650" /LENGTH=299 /DNA_ID=CAMNT_0003484227 /DNA_START=89 /DNA_END=988 /DNA_ORIENTATION=-